MLVNDRESWVGSGRGGSTPVFSDAFLSVRAAFVADDNGRFVAEVEAAGLQSESVPSSDALGRGRSPIILWPPRRPFPVKMPAGRMTETGTMVPTPPGSPGGNKTRRTRDGL